MKAISTNANLQPKGEKKISDINKKILNIKATYILKGEINKKYKIK